VGVLNNLNKGYRMKALWDFVWITAVITVVMMGVVYLPIACQPAHAEPGMLAESVEDEEDGEDKSVSQCPFTLMTDQESCQKCHEVRKVDGAYVWGVQDETWRPLPNQYSTAIIQHDGKEAMYFKLTSIDSDMTRKVYEFMVKYGMKYLEMEIYSPGGSVIEAWRIQSQIKEYEQKHGITTATVVRGYAASAGMIILASGTKGHRYGNPYAEIMCHELWSITWLAIDTPSSTKDKFEVMKHFQDNLNNWLAEVSNVDQEYISQKIHKKDWWMYGSEAKEMGFIDHFIYDEDLFIGHGDPEPFVQEGH